jgi:hypothetical protein
MALSFRGATQTPSLEAIYSANSFTAAARPGLPLILSVYFRQELVTLISTCDAASEQGVPTKDIVELIGR